MKTRVMIGLFGLGLVLTPAIPAQNLNYAGKVVDPAGTPLPWALIRLEGGTVVTQSDANGAFTITGTAPMGIFSDPNPNRLRPMSLEPEAAPARFQSDGRILSVTHDAEGARFLRSPPSHTPQSLAKTSAGSYVIGVSKVNYQNGSFPQALASATGLILTLSKSPTDTATYAAEKKLCLDTINACRAKLNLKPVTWSKSLEAFADEGARYDAGLNAAHSHFGKFSVRAVPADAENALPGWPIKNYKSVAAVVQKGTEMMWNEGPGGGHYENIKGDQTTVGCGVFVTATGNIWVVQDFK
jgi:uncharacterized protein YkwD